MSMVDRWGVSLQVVRREKPEQEKSKDMIVLALRAQGLTWREIGSIMKVYHNAAYKRWHAIPKETRTACLRSLG